MTTRRDFITLLGGGGGVADLGARAAGRQNSARGHPFARQQRSSRLFLKSGWAGSFWKSRPEKGPVRRASRAVVCASRDRGDRPPWLGASDAYCRGFYFSPASSRIAVSAARWYGHSLHLCTIMSGSNFGSVVFSKCRCHTPMLKQ